MESFDWRAHSIWDWIQWNKKEYILVRWIPADINGLFEFPMDWWAKDDFDDSAHLFASFKTSSGVTKARIVRSKLFNLICLIYLM